MQTIKEEIEIISRNYTGYVYKKFSKYLWEIYFGRIAYLNRESKGYKFIGIMQGNCDTYVEAKSMLNLIITALESAIEIGNESTEKHIVYSLVEHTEDCKLCNNILTV